jgi:hypothetical protein
MIFVTVTPSEALRMYDAIQSFSSFLNGLQQHLNPNLVMMACDETGMAI